MSTKGLEIKDLRQIEELVARGALFAVNHSGGKDSQAMLAMLLRFVPARQMVIVHAALGRVEWPDTENWVRKYAAQIPVIIAKAIWKEGGEKELLENVVKRGMFPSPQQRWCTSDLKRGPIEREIRHYIKANGLSGLIVNCVGVRAEESDNRECGLDKVQFKTTGEVTTLIKSERNSLAGREWYEYLPIHHLTTEQVFAVIAETGEIPHWAYAQGSTRLSCCFCIMASKSDLQVAAKARPELFREYVQLENKLGRSMLMPQKQSKKSIALGEKPVSMFLEDYLGIKAEKEAA